jgi:hypothetical protein
LDFGLRPIAAGGRLSVPVAVLVFVFDDLCTAAAMRAAARASAWVGNGSENTPLTAYAQPSSCRTI